MVYLYVHVYERMQVYGIHVCAVLLWCMCALHKCVLMYVVLCVCICFSSSKQVRTPDSVLLFISLELSEESFRIFMNFKDKIQTDSCGEAVRTS